MLLFPAAVTDKNPGGETAAQFQKLGEAYQVQQWWEGVRAEGHLPHAYQAHPGRGGWREAAGAGTQLPHAAELNSLRDC